MHRILMTLDKVAINQLSDGIVLLDGKGAITDINRMAPASLKCVIANRGRIAGWVSEAVKGKLPLPADLSLPNAGAADVAALPATLCANGRRGFAMVIRAAAQLNGDSRGRGRDVMPLIGEALREELRTVADRLRHYNPTGNEAGKLRKQAVRLERQLREIAALAELGGRDMVFSEHRIQLAGVLHDLLPRLPRRTGEAAVHYLIEDSGDDLGSVYGNLVWLQQALCSLLGRLAGGCPPGGQVRIALRQIGDHVVMSARFVTRAEAAFVPAAEQVVRDGNLLEDGVSMEICRRIIELHGGQLRFEPTPGSTDEEAGPVDSFTLTLPTGLPVADRSRVSCAECRITHQAMQYARDLAEMMADVAGSMETKDLRKAS